MTDNTWEYTAQDLQKSVEALTRDKDKYRKLFEFAVLLLAKHPDFSEMHPSEIMTKVVSMYEEGDGD